jgi:guanylate kinase
MMEKAHRGLLFVVSAPSGVGKTTIIQEIRGDFPALLYSVSCTTRQPRPYETDGKDYHFLGKQEFLDGVGAGRFLEWAEVHGEYYGTDGDQVEGWLAQGSDVLLDIDVQGARQVRCTYPHAHMIFILPPTLQTLKERLRKRATETADQMSLRLSAAEREIREASCYDFLIINDLLDEAVADFKAVIRACRCTRAYQAARLIKGILSPHSSLRQ